MKKILLASAVAFSAVFSMNAFAFGYCSGFDVEYGAVYTGNFYTTDDGVMMYEKAIECKIAPFLENSYWSGYRWYVSI